MRIPRVYLQNELAPGRHVVLDERSHNHVQRVLRMRAGDPLLVFNGQGGQFDARLTRCDKRECSVEVGEHSDSLAESQLTTTLLQGLCRNERMDTVIQKATELGVSHIRPVICERSVVQPDERRLQRRLAHWHSVMISACEQSGRTRLPTVFEPVPLEQAVTEVTDTLRLLLHPGSSKALPRHACPDDHRISVLIGPEGGLDDNEISFAEGNGFVATAVGPRVLRTETAGPACLAVIQTLWGDMGT